MTAVIHHRIAARGYAPGEVWTGRPASPSSRSPEHLVVAGNRGDVTSLDAKRGGGTVC